MKALKYLTVAFVSLGLIVAFVPKQTVTPMKINSEQIVTEIKQKAYYISSDDLASIIINKDPLYKLVDVRDVAEFQSYSLPGATNIDLKDIISTNWEEFMNQDKYTIVLYSNSNLEAVEAWILCRQKGYENIYVLQGGLNNWYETIVNPKHPASTLPDEDQAKYDFRKAAGKALGVDGNDSSAVASPVKVTTGGSKPTTGPKKKKKGASGGCG
ncbi:MAG: rhodanese-like domain-containing protein [Bacteroidia bacterium]|nr:rhodanese-like domain-containing protein [Bacteroidia bacterium]